MAYGLKIINGLDQVIIDDTKVSMVKSLFGTISPVFQSGDAITATNGIGKGSSGVSTTYPYSDEIYGGTRKTLYFYDVVPTGIVSSGPDVTRVTQNLVFFKLPAVGDEAIIGSVTRRNPLDYGQNITQRGIHATSSTLQWAIMEPRVVTDMPTGFGMAMYDSAGNCNWAADDKLAVVPYILQAFDALTDLSITASFSGWFSITSPLVFAFDGPGPSRYLGRLKRTATGLDYLCNTKYALSTWGADEAARNNERDAARASWGDQGIYKNKQRLLLGSMG